MSMIQKAFLCGFAIAAMGVVNQMAFADDSNCQYTQAEYKANVSNMTIDYYLNNPNCALGDMRAISQNPAGNSAVVRCNDSCIAFFGKDAKLHPVNISEYQPIGNVGILQAACQSYCGQPQPAVGMERRNK